jgi:hypothetical protein
VARIRCVKWAARDAATGARVTTSAPVEEAGLPSAFRGLPESYRITRAKTVLGLLRQPIGRSDALESSRDQNSALALVMRQIVCKNA